MGCAWLIEEAAGGGNMRLFVFIGTLKTDRNSKEFLDLAGLLDLQVAAVGRSALAQF